MQAHAGAKTESRETGQELAVIRLTSRLFLSLTLLDGKVESSKGFSVSQAVVLNEIIPINPLVVSSTQCVESPGKLV